MLNLEDDLKCCENCPYRVPSDVPQKITDGEVSSVVSLLEPGQAARKDPVTGLWFKLNPGGS